MITSSWRGRLHDHLGGKLCGLGGFSDTVEDVTDHVHLLAELKATHCLADVLRELKKASSIWAHEEMGLHAFEWQEGYAAFTVSVTSINAVRRHILDQ